MFLLTIINPENAKRIRRIFYTLSEAEGYCDWCENCRIPILELEKVDTTLSTLLATSWAC
jgi:hypothetical protein